MLEHTAQGYDGFTEKIRELSETKKRIIVLFTGSKLLTTGQSWCPDCVTAEPEVRKIVESDEVKKIDAHFLTCYVGNRDVWKNPQCEFRQDPKLKLTCIPTLLEYGSKVRKLVDSQCCNHVLVKDLFGVND